MLAKLRALPAALHWKLPTVPPHLPAMTFRRARQSQLHVNVPAGVGRAIVAGLRQTPLVELRPRRRARPTLRPLPRQVAEEFRRLLADPRVRRSLILVSVSLGLSLLATLLVVSIRRALDFVNEGFVIDAPGAAIQPYLDELP